MRLIDWLERVALARALARRALARDSRMRAAGMSLCFRAEKSK